MSDRLEALSARIDRDVSGGRERLRSFRKAARELRSERVDVSTIWGRLELLARTLDNEALP